MDKKAEVFNPEKDSSVKTINLDSGENAKEYKNYLVLPNNAVVKVTDPSNPQNPVYDPDKIYFAQKNLSGEKFGPTKTGSWKQLHDPAETEEILKTVDSHN